METSNQKMRKALKELRDAARAFTHQIRNSKYSHILDKYTCREQGFPAYLDLRVAIPNANFVLSAPPRNCDRFAKVEDSQVTFLNEEWLLEVDSIKHHPFNIWTDGMKAAYAKWLFAPSATSNQNTQEEN